MINNNDLRIQQAQYNALMINNNERRIQQAQYDVLNEPSPLGLRLKKSPSLLELAQMRVNQSNAKKGILLDENLQVEPKRYYKPRTKARASSSIDKLKASHFPASVLRIGRWEYVSQHEGDLVAKCYFSKHKLVWEVLDGGLKKKFEVNWADIVALKANCQPDAPGTLTIVLDKRPRFFKEINPQPRKHTQWRATSDFTGGEASIHRQQFLQCAPGVLDKHYEKLIQCDTRLYFLSQQQDFVLEFPYFPPKPPTIDMDDEDLSGDSGLNFSEVYNIAHMSSPSALLIPSPQIVESSSFNFMHPNMSNNEAYSAGLGLVNLSGMHMDINRPRETEQLTLPCLGLTMSLPDPVNHTGNHSGNSLNEQNMSTFSQNAPDHKSLDNLSQMLFDDSNGASDKICLMVRVDSWSDCLQGSHNGQQQRRNDSSTLTTGLSLLMPENISQEGGGGSGNGSGSICEPPMLPQNYPYPNPNAVQGGLDNATPGSGQVFMNEVQGDENGSGDNEELGMTRKDSFADMLHQLPRIASLPRFLFEISESGEILR